LRRVPPPSSSTSALPRLRDSASSSLRGGMAISYVIFHLLSYLILPYHVLYHLTLPLVFFTRYSPLCAAAFFHASSTKAHDLHAD
jgi:hypothetical protein